MNFLKVRALTPGQRFKVKRDFSVLTQVKPEKSLLKKKTATGGRNNAGKMTMRYIGSGCKQKLREIDFKRQKDNIEAVVKSIEYDPTHTAFVALVCYSDGEKRYILAPDNLKVGDKIASGNNVLPEIGCCLQMKKIPTGTFIYNIELNPGGGGKIARSAGCCAQLVSKDKDLVTVKLPSGQTRNIPGDCRATIGIPSNINHSNEMLGKAGINRLKGIRPRVRGVAMNPVDHPMGGGEGKASGGHPRSRKGKPAKGLKTRKSNKYSNKYINVK